MYELLTDPASPVLWALIIAILAGAIGVVSRPFSSYIRFVYPNAKFEAMGNPYIKQAALQRILESPSLEGFKDQLNSQKDYRVDGETAGAVQQSLDTHLKDALAQMKADHSRKMHPFFDTILFSLDARIIKQTFYLLINDKEIPEDLPQRACSDRTITLLHRLINAESEQYTQILKSYSFSDSLLEAMQDSPAQYLQLDAAVDRYVHGQLSTVSVPKTCKKGITQYLAFRIDLQTIQHILRAKHLGLDEESCKSLFLGEGFEIAAWKFNELCQANSVSDVLSQLEGTRYYQSLKKIVDGVDITRSVQALNDALDRYMLEIIKDISNDHYVSIGPTLRFLVSKQIEITNLKIIVKGIAEQLSKDQIMPLLIMEEH